MKNKPIPNITLKEILNIGEKIDNRLDRIDEKIDTRFDRLQKHFDERHDKAFKAINDNSKQIEIIKMKQIIVACLAGFGGAQITGNFKDILDVLKKIFLLNF